MFKIQLMPQSNRNIEYKHTVITVNGAVITYDGVEYDFSGLPDNCEVEPQYPAVGKIKKVNGLISISLMYIYNSNLAETVQSIDALDYEFFVDAGEVPCPIVWLPEPVEGEENV